MRRGTAALVTRGGARMAIPPRQWPPAALNFGNDHADANPVPRVSRKQPGRGCGLTSRSSARPQRIAAALCGEGWWFRAALALLFALYVRTIGFAPVYDDNVISPWSGGMERRSEVFHPRHLRLQHRRALGLLPSAGDAVGISGDQIHGRCSGIASPVGDFSAPGRGGAGLWVRTPPLRRPAPGAADGAAVRPASLQGGERCVDRQQLRGRAGRSVFLRLADRVSEVAGDVGGAA